MTLFDGFFDDAALFPPGNLPLEVALPAHRDHRRTPRSRYTGLFVLPAATLQGLTELRSHLGDEDPIELALTFPDGPHTVAQTLRAAAQARGVAVTAAEVAVPHHVSLQDTVTTLLADVPEGVLVFVEIPRDQRRVETIDRLADSPMFGKFRTGGVRADAYPDAAELADGIHRAVSRGLSWKATAGLHRAVRNTHPYHAFEQHGFLNILIAVSAAVSGAGAADLTKILEQRDGAQLARVASTFAPDDAANVRKQFRSVGTCSIREPLEDLVSLGLIGADVLFGSGQGACR